MRRRVAAVRNSHSQWRRDPGGFSARRIPPPRYLYQVSQPPHPLPACDMNATQQPTRRRPMAPARPGRAQGGRIQPPSAERELLSAVARSTRPRSLRSRTATEARGSACRPRSLGRRADFAGRRSAKPLARFRPAFRARPLPRSLRPPCPDGASSDGFPPSMPPSASSCA